jgi:hypothetical protein
LGLARLGWKAKKPRMTGLGLDMNYWSCFRVTPGVRAMTRVQYANVNKSHWVVYDGVNIFDSNILDSYSWREYPYRPLSYMLFEPEI